MSRFVLLRLCLYYYCIVVVSFLLSIVASSNTHQQVSPQQQHKHSSITTNIQHSLHVITTNHASATATAAATTAAMNVTHHQHQHNHYNSTSMPSVAAAKTTTTKTTTTSFPGTVSKITPSTFKCDLCKSNYTFIMATGRSGSTTLLDMINQLDRYDIGGEHDGQFNPLYQQYQAFKSAKRVAKKASDGSSWGNRQLYIQDFLCWIQSWFQISSGMKDTYNTMDVHGFKEIRYDRLEVLEFIHEVFPCGKFILNMRNDVEEQHKSTFRKHTPVNALQHHNDVLIKFAEKYPKQTHFMILEDYHDLKKWNELFTWLDRPHCKATDVLDSHGNHSFVIDHRKVVVCDSK